jgi:hypothetical protein
MIKQQNDLIAKLTAKINEHELENEKFQFARSMLYNGRCPGIKDDIGFQQGSNVKLNAPKRLSNFVKGKAPVVQDSEGYILYPANYPEHKIRRIHARKPHAVSHHAFMYKNEASSSRQSIHVKLLLELALLGKLIQREGESNVNRVLTRDGNSSVNLASQGHCAGVFIGTRVPDILS